MARELRDYQIEAVEAARAEWAKGVLRPALVLATGLGKTDILARLVTDAAAEGRKVLCLAHRFELLDQITARCRMHRPDIPIGRVAAGVDQRGFPITVASVPTLARPARRARMQRPDLVVYDECHHAPAPSGRAILDWAGCYESTPAVGLTATLVRGDKYKPSSVWQSVPFERDIAWAVANGWLVQPRGRVVVADHLDLQNVKMNSRGTDFADGELGEMVSQDIPEIVKAWMNQAGDRITAGFWPTVAAAQEATEEFLRQGVPAECVLGNTAPSVRGNVENGTGVYGRLYRGEARVMNGVMVMSEGWDCAPVSCILMARPTRLPGLYTQICGRALRLHPSKNDALILDVVGSSRGQRLIGLTDLSEAFEVDTTELDALPCPDCGGFRPAAVRADPDLNPCSCEREQGLGRDPDGGRARLQGPARYVDLPLLPDPKATFRWQRSRLGVPFLMGSLPWCRDRAGILYPDSGHADSPTWTPGHVAVRGPASWTRLDDAPCTFEQARQRVQLWAGPSPKVPGGAVPEWLLGKAAALGVPDPHRLDRRALQDAVAVARVSAVVDR